MKVPAAAAAALRSKAIVVIAVALDLKKSEVPDVIVRSWRLHLKSFDIGSIEIALGPKINIPLRF